MQPLRIKQIGNLKWSVAFLIAIASVMILAGTASQAQHEDGPGKLVATGTDAAPQVLIDNFVYSPVPLTVKVGTTVTWINHDDIPHTVESKQGKLNPQRWTRTTSSDLTSPRLGNIPFIVGFIRR